MYAGHRARIPRNIQPIGVGAATLTLAVKVIQNYGNPQQKTAMLAEKFRHGLLCLITMPTSQVLTTVSSWLIAMFQVPARESRPGRLQQFKPSADPGYNWQPHEFPCWSYGWQ